MDELNELQTLVNGSKKIVFFGGAGVSTESGIPDFRSEDGLYRQKYKFPPETILSHEFFYTHTREFYDFYFDKMIYPTAKPNAAHIALAKMEKQGKLSAVITQNIDGLHQAAGSKSVFELHGSVYRNRCTRCGKFFGLDYIEKYKGKIPVCECGNVIKPEVVLYGESLDDEVVTGALNALETADLVIVGGTSLGVYPAAGFLNYTNAPVVLINKSATPFDSRAKLVINGYIGKVLENIII